MREDSFVTNNDIRTRYWSVGRGGVPLVLLHGLGGTVEDWAGTMGPLAQYRRVIAIDLLGCGRTDKPENCIYSLEAMRDHVLKVLDALELDVVDLNGWSLGGRIALDIAHLTPDRVRCLVLTAPAGIGADTLLDLTAPWNVLLRQGISRPANSANRIVRNALRSGGAKRLARFSARRVMLVTDRAARNVFLRQLRSIIGPSGYLAKPRDELLCKLPEIRTPTFAIWGTEDYFAPFSHAAMLRTKMPNCTIHPIQRCGHTPHIEWPDIYVSAVNSFLK